MVVRKTLSRDRFKKLLMGRYGLSRDLAEETTQRVASFKGQISYFDMYLYITTEMIKRAFSAYDNQIITGGNLQQK